MAKKCELDEYAISSEIIDNRPDSNVPNDFDKYIINREASYFIGHNRILNRLLIEDGYDPVTFDKVENLDQFITDLKSMRQLLLD